MAIKLNGADCVFAALGSHILLMDDAINLKGVNEDGSLWCQLEPDKEMDEPYLNSYGYKVTLSECTEENNNAPIEIYKWIYRCIKQAYTTKGRTIFCNGKTTRLYPNIATDAAFGYGVVQVPYEVFSASNIDISIISRRVVRDNHFIASGFGLGSVLGNGCSVPVNEQDFNSKNATIEQSILEVDTKIQELYGFTPESKPQTVEEKVKTAKVIFDWLRLNNLYGWDGEWGEGTVYAALSKGEVTPICSGYASSAHLLLERYGIESIVCVGWRRVGDSETHAWNMVNYHDEIGDYTEDSSQWCIFDSTGNTQGTLASWAAFNRPWADGEYIPFTSEKLPTTTPMDAEHKYSGSNHYSW